MSHHSFSDLGKKLMDVSLGLDGDSSTEMLQEMEDPKLMLALMARLLGVLENFTSFMFMKDHDENGCNRSPVSSGVMAMVDASGGAIPLDKLSVRSRNVLIRYNISTWLELKNMGPDKIRCLRGFGLVSLRELKSLCKMETGRSLFLDR